MSINTTDSQCNLEQAKRFYVRTNKKSIGNINLSLQILPDMQLFCLFQNYMAI